MNRLSINTCVVAALGAIVVGGLLAEANTEHGGFGLENHGGYGSGYGSGYGGYGSSYMPGSQYLGGEHGSGLASHGSHGLGGHLGAGLSSHPSGGLGGHGGYGGYGSHGYGGEHGNYGVHESGLYGGHHGAHHGGQDHYGRHHGGSGGQVKALLKGAGRSVLAQNPELASKVHEFANNPSVRRGAEKLMPKLNKLGQQAKPFLREGAKVMKGKLTETVNQQNLKQGYMAAEGAGLHHY